MLPRLCCLSIAALLAAGCSETPTEPTRWSASDIRDRLLATNVNNQAFRTSGRTTRWHVPIEANANGIARAERALTNLEQWSGGLIRFTRVSGVPANGIYFVEGGGRNGDNSPGCGNITDAPPPEPSRFMTFRTASDASLIGTTTVHLGSEACNDETQGHYPSAIAEHELGHALGMATHFDGFVGDEGASDALMLAVLLSLYANPVGTPAADVQIVGPR